MGEDNKIDVTAYLDALYEGEIKNEFYELIENLSKAEANPIVVAGNLETPKEQALDFILYLKANPGVCSITTKKALKRELKRWLIKKGNPEYHDLWGILSAALLDLEKEGECVRKEEFRNYNNSNNTQWALVEFTSFGIVSQVSASKRKGIPSFSPEKRKTDAIKQSRTITPTSAKKLARSILEAAGGFFRMENIVKVAGEKVFMSNASHPESIHQQNDDDADDMDCNEKISCLPSSIVIYIMEEAEHRAVLIWDALSTVARGKNQSVTGHKILCLYIIPATMTDKKVNLSEFGATSTVSDVKDDTEKIMRKYLTFESIPEATRGYLPSLEEIKIRVVEQLNAKCSENGYETGLTL